MRDNNDVEQNSTVTEPGMALPNLQRELVALPVLVLAPATESEDSTDVAPRPPAHLDIATRQGRLMMRLTASTEAMQAKYSALEGRFGELATELRSRDVRLEELGEARRLSDRKVRQIALEAVHLMDALDWAHSSLQANQQEGLAREMAAAQRDCLRRLAAVGITEIPCQGMMDGRLHEGLETIEGSEMPRYHIVSVIRRGYQMGTDVLRRAHVATAA